MKTDPQNLILLGNSGLGAASIREFARHKPAQIWLAARTRTTAEEIAKSVRDEVADANIIILDLDLGSLDSVKAAAKRLNDETQRIDLLMLNAGIASTPPALSADGYELQFATNYLGHVLFTQYMLPKLLLSKSAEPAADVRIVAVASRAHNFAPSGGLHLDRVKTDMRSNMGMVRYGHSKLAVILWVRKMAEHYTQIKTIATDPGTVDTGLVRGGAQSHPWLAKLAKPVMRMIGQTADIGARCQLWGSVSPDAKSGEYYEPVGKDGVTSAQGCDDKLANALWEWTEKELKEKGGPGWAASE